MYKIKYEGDREGRQKIKRLIFQININKIKGCDNRIWDQCKTNRKKENKMILS